MVLGGEDGKNPGKPVGRDVGRWVSTAIKLVLLCFLVGLALTWLGVTPLALLENFWEGLRDAWAAAAKVPEWAFPYIATGAVIVLPIWAVVALLGWLKRRRS